MNSFLFKNGKNLYVCICLCEHRQGRVHTKVAPRGEGGGGRERGSVGFKGVKGKKIQGSCPPGAASPAGKLRRPSRSHLENEIGLRVRTGT